ncbi:MAG: hypothetical protein N2C14_01125, partial [Planctomycetales bacterium]
MKRAPLPSLSRAPLPSLSFAPVLFAFLLAGTLSAAVPDSVLNAESARVNAIAKVRPSVVAIFARGGQGG